MITVVYTVLVEFLPIVFYTNSYGIGFKPQPNSISDIILKERRKCLRSAFWCYFKRQLDSYKQTKSNSVNRKKLIFWLRHRKNCNRYCTFTCRLKETFSGSVTDLHGNAFWLMFQACHKKRYPFHKKVIWY